MLGELCGCLPHRPLASRHRCDVPVRWSHLSTADWLACLPSPVFGSVCLDLITFRWWDLVGTFSLVHRRAIWLMPAGLVGSVECGRNKEATGLIHCFPEGLLGLFDCSCFTSFSITCPVHFLEVDVGSPRPINRGQFGDEAGWMIACQLGGDWPD